MKRSAPLQRKTRLRRVSTKRAAINVERSRFVREQLALRPACEAGSLISDALAEVVRWGASTTKWKGWTCSGIAVDLHEPILRSRDPSTENILSPERCVAICRACHEWVHANPALATTLGLMKSAGRVH